MSERPEVWNGCRHDGELTVLVVGFEAARGEARLADLAEHFGPSHFLVSQPARLAAPIEAAGTYLDKLSDALGKAITTVDAVIGYCAGAPLAAGLAARLADGERRPFLAVIDPEVVDERTIVNEYLAALASLGARSEDATPGAGASMRVERVGALACSLAAGYRRAAETAAEQVGLGAAFVDQLTTRWNRYLAYLVAAAHAGNSLDAADLVLVSADYPGVAGPAAEGNCRRFDAPGSRLLADPELAVVLRQALAPASKG